MKTNITNTCIADCQSLIELAEGIVAVRPSFSDEAEAWFNEIRQVAVTTDLHSFVGERTLERLSGELRELWLRSAFNVTARIMKSPPHQQKNHLPSGDRVWFDYERAYKPEPLENKLTKMPEVPPHWENRSILFSSAMGALMTISQVFGARLDGVRPDTVVKLGMFGGYFETWRMLNYLHDRDFEIIHFADNAELLDSIVGGEVDIMLVEPVSYDWDMEVFDIKAFHAAYDIAESNAPRLLIIDTTLVGPGFCVSDFLNGFKMHRPWMVLCVRSGLKLDQQGLELANMGVVDIFVPTDSERPINASEAHFRLKVARAVFGTGINVQDAGVLEVPWVSDVPLIKEFSAKVFDHNAYFASRITLTGKVFTRLVHPAVNMDSLPNSDVTAEAPFVMLHLPISEQKAFGHLVAILVFEIQARGLNWDMGSSFGFRGHRFEVIKANVQVRPNDDRYGMLKVAMGSRGGPSVDGIVELVNEIAAYADWETLKSAYAHVPPFVSGKAGLFVARPRRSV